MPTNLESKKRPCGIVACPDLATEDLDLFEPRKTRHPEFCEGSAKCSQLKALKATATLKALNSGKQFLLLRALTLVESLEI